MFLCTEGAVAGGDTRKAGAIQLKAHSRVRLRRLRWDPEALRLVQLVAVWRSVPVDNLVHNSRCSGETALSRQLAMYLIHVIVGRSYDEVSVLFRRHRSTVAHACKHIEDLRDDRAFDEQIGAIESLFHGYAGTSEDQHEAA